MATQVEIMHAAGFVTAAEAASLIGANHVGTVHRMVKKGHVVGERVGIHWYVNACSLLASVDGSPTMQNRITQFMAENGVARVYVKNQAPAGTIKYTEVKRGKGKRRSAR